MTKVGKGRHIYMRACSSAPYVTHGWKTLQMHTKVQRAVTLILMHESKFFQVKSLVSTHSACPCKIVPNAPKPAMPCLNLRFFFST